MKKLALSLVIFGFCAYAVKTGESKQPRESISFEQLLKQLSEDLVKSVKFPEPSLEKETEAAFQADDRYWVTILAADKYERTKLLELGMDIVEVKKDKVSGIVHQDTLNILAEENYVIEGKMTLAEYILQSARDFPPADSAYHNYKETTELLKNLASHNPDVASLFSIGRTIEGRDIWCLRISAGAKGRAAGAKPGAVYIGNHHAREHLSNEVALLFGVWLLEHKNDADIKRYIDTLDIYIIPMLNPDGVEYDIRTGKYQWQRKNMRVNIDKTIGVDLNRNYDSWWGGTGSSHYTYSDTYCGTAAFSEPETQAVKKFVEARKNLKTLMSYHSYSSTIMYPWGGKDTPVEDGNDRRVFVKMADEMSKFTGYSPEQASDMYVSTGDTCDWAYEIGRIFAFTTELEGDSFYPGAGIIDHAVNSNIKAALYMLSVADNPYKVAE